MGRERKAVTVDDLLAGPTERFMNCDGCGEPYRGPNQDLNPGDSIQLNCSICNTETLYKAERYITVKGER